MDAVVITIIRTLLFAQILLFGYAALAHFGIVGDRDDPSAGTAETIIAVALLGGLVWSLARPELTRTAALVSQGFAMLGTMVGFTLVMTVGPRTTFDMTMHGAMLVLLAVGLYVTATWQPDGENTGLARRPHGG